MQDLTPEQVFAARVRLARNEAGMSQADLAEQLTARHGIELDPTAITRLEKGRRTIRLNEAIALADILHIPLAEVPALPKMTAREAKARLRELDRQLEKLETDEMKTSGLLSQGRAQRMEQARRRNLLTREYAALERLTGVPVSRLRFQPIDDYPPEGPY